MGFALEPTRGRCPLDPCQRARPFEICPLVLEPEGPTQTLRGHGRPLWFQRQNERFQGPLPLAEIQEAFWSGSGAEAGASSVQAIPMPGTARKLTARAYPVLLCPFGDSFMTVWPNGICHGI